MSTSSPPPIEPVPAPWTLKATVYTFLLYITSSEASKLSENKSFLYAPLEANSSFADDKFIGGLATVQVLRYSESPVGPYDELLIVPGKFEYPFDVTTKDGRKKTERKRNLKLTRIYVSQEKTCWNGRKNWNIPKHLARFTFQDLPNGATKISVYPMEPDSTGVESKINEIPFFSASYKPISYIPHFPASTGAFKYLGLDLSLVQPPLPKGKGQLNELPGTDQWAKSLPVIKSSKTSLGWWDLKSGGATESDSLLERQGNEAVSTKYENWWPDIGRWRFGMKMEDATVWFGVSENWAQAGD